MSQNRLIATELSRTRDIVKNRHILAIQDTTELNYQAHAGRVQGLGTVGNGTDVGMFMHPLLVVDAETGAALGCGAIQVWNRTTNASENYPKLPIEEKESYRWISTAEQGKKTLSAAHTVTVIGDRESDIYEVFDRLPDEKTQVLIRSRGDRCLSNGDTLNHYVEQLSELGQTRFILPKESRRNRSTREVHLSIKYGEVVIKKPLKCTDKSAATTIRLRIVDVREIAPPIKEERIHWRLLTTHTINELSDAIQIIRWYQQRWQIEQLFRTMKKQGIDVESSQVEVASSLSKLAIIAVCAAVRIMQLVLARDGDTQLKVNEIFNGEEQLVLTALLRQLEGKTEKQKNPFPRDNLAWASWIIARKGGWKGYKSESPPGPITMGRGLKEFHSMVAGWKLFKDVYIG